MKIIYSRSEIFSKGKNRYNIFDYTGKDMYVSSYTEFNNTISTNIFPRMTEEFSQQENMEINNKNAKEVEKEIYDEGMGGYL